MAAFAARALPRVGWITEQRSGANDNREEYNDEKNLQTRRPQGFDCHGADRLCLADPPLDETLLRPEANGLRHLGAFAVRPSIALPRLLEGATLRFNSEIRSLDEIDADLAAGADR